MKKYYILISTVVVMLFSCLSVETGKLLAEAEIYQQKCSKCHSLRIPDNYTKKEWKYNVERMAGRAGLTPGEIQNIIDLNKRK